MTGMMGSLHGIFAMRSQRFDMDKIREAYFSKKIIINLRVLRFCPAVSNLFAQHFVHLCTAIPRCGGV